MDKSHRLIQILGILKRNEVYKGLTPKKLTNVFAELGPTFIKFGQVLAMRRDFLPKEYCDELLSLQTNVNPMPYETVIQVIEEELGQKAEDVFVYIDKEPLGSASIAQVHRAVLKEGDREVVIKVQRPKIYETMRDDIYLIKRAAKMLKRFASKTPIGVIDFEGTIDEFWETTKEELDFEMEAKNLKTFKELNSDINYIDSPDILEDISTKRILVMDYIPGVDIDQSDLLIQMGYDLDEVASKLCRNYLKQVISDGYFHADPHPGNIRIHDGEICWIDLGMMGNLSNRDRVLFRRALSAIAYNDTEELKSAFLALGVHDGEINESILYGQIDDMLEGATRSCLKSIRDDSCKRCLNDE